MNTKRKRAKKEYGKEQETKGEYGKKQEQRCRKAEDVLFWVRFITYTDVCVSVLIRRIPVVRCNLKTQSGMVGFHE